MAVADTKQFIVTYLNNGQYGIDIQYIDNIIVMQSITRVPKAQAFFKGIINLRGEIIPVMSLRRRLGIEEEAHTSKSRIIIVRPEPGAAPVGLIVDSVKEVVALEAEAIENMVYEETDVKANYSIGIGKHNGELINLLSVPHIVTTKEA